MSTNKKPLRLKHSKSRRIEEGLRRIYDLNKDGTRDVSLKAMDIAERPIIRRILLWFIGAIVCMGILLAGLIFFSQRTQIGTSRDALHLAFLPVESLTSGTQTPLILTYKNQSSKRLVNVDIAVTIPQTVQYIDAQPSPKTTEPLLWQFSILEPGENGEIVLQTIPLLQPNFSQNIQATARFQPEHLSVSFDTLSSLNLTSTSSIFTLNSTQNERVLTEEVSPYTFTITTAQSIPADTYLFSLAIPEGFRVQNMQPQAKEDTLTWSLPAMEEQKAYTITIQGSFSSDQSGEKHLTGSLVTNTAIPLTQMQTIAKTQVLGNAFSLSLFGNGQTGTVILTPGNDLVLSTALRNTGEESAEDIRIELVVDNGLSRLDLSKRRGAPLGKTKQNKVVWAKEDLSRLETLRPNEDALLDTAIPTLLTGADTIELHAVAHIKSIGGIVSEKRISSSPLIVRLASNTTITARGQYFDADGVAIGTGPIPPAVGQSTVYRLTMEIVNPLHALNQAVITAPLGAHAAWQGSLDADVGTISFDSVSGRVRWAIGTLPIGTKPIHATFDIRVTPSTEDLNHFATILGVASLNATDTVTQSPITTKGEVVTTEIPGDTHAKDRGIVVGASISPSDP